VRVFKTKVLAAFADVVDAVHGAMPWLSEEAARDLVTALTSLAASLWSISHPPETLARLFREDPALGHASVDFVPRLTRLIHATALGLAAREAP
jgi:hypothetical protein